MAPDLSFQVLHHTRNGNLLLKPMGHKEAIGKKTALYLKRKGEKLERVAEIFDTIAQVENPFYLAKPFVDVELEEKILITK